MIPDEQIRLTDKDLCNADILERLIINYYTLREYARTKPDYGLLFTLDDLEDFIRYSPKIKPVTRECLLKRMEGFNQAESAQLLGKCRSVIQKSLNRGYRHIIKHYGGDYR